MKKVLFLLLVTIAGRQLMAQTWSGDKAHSHFTFTVVHLGINDIDGAFTDFDTEIKATKPDFSDATVHFVARTASVNTNSSMRDEHIKSPDFFDVVKFPEITFQSTFIKKIANNKYQLKGNLTLLGKTKPVICELTYRGTVKNPQSNQDVAGLSITGSLKRSDFAFGGNFPAPLLSNEVTFKASGEFKK